MNVLKLFDLTGKVAIVTGGSRGLGKEMAIGLGEAGAKVAIAARHEEWLNPAYEEMKGMGIDCLALKCNVRELSEVTETVAETMNKWGRLDILVNNAGTSWMSPTETMPLKGWDAVMNTNVTGPFFFSQEAGKHMIKQKSGVIINIASVLGLLGISPEIGHFLPYHASKGALITMTRELAVEWAPYNIRVNAIAPFFFPSRLTKPVLDEHTDDLVQRIPMGRLGKEGELKGLALYLASEASSYITGQVICVDGGASAW